MPARIGIERRYPHQPMHARFGFQPAVGVVTADLDGSRFDPGLFALRLFQIFDLEAVLLGPARVHAQQHLGPVLALSAPRAGVNLEIAIQAIGFARQQRFQFPPRDFLLEALSAASASATTPVSFSASPSSIIPTLSSSSRSTLPMPVSASSSEVRSCISFCAFWGSSQSLGSSASLFSSARRAVDFSTSKMPPQQPDRLLDLFD